MPLAWAHAEFIKLLVSRQLGQPFDRSSTVWQRYRGRRPKSPNAFWLPQAPLSTLARGTGLIIALDEPAVIHWGVDGWQNATDTATRDSGLGLHYAQLDTRTLQPGQRIDFTFRDTASDRWTGRNYTITVEYP